MTRLDPFARFCLFLAAAILCAAVPAVAETTPQSPTAAQPVVPEPVDKLSAIDRPPLEVRKHAIRTFVHRRRVARHHVHVIDVERPALAGVTLVDPLPPPGEPPHVAVPTPAYPFESLAAAFTTPPPPVMCHHTARDPYAPDPHLYREAAVQCLPDNP